MTHTVMVEVKKPGYIYIDDESVSTVRHEDVFAGYEDEWADDGCASLLFYRRSSHY